MILENFKKIVDNYKSKLKRSDLNGYYDFLGIDSISGVSNVIISRKIYDNIKEAVSKKESITNDDIHRNELIKLREELIYRHILYNENPTKYLKIIRIILDSCNGSQYFMNFTHQTNWETAINYSIEYDLFSPETFHVPLTKIRDEYPKEYDIASSLHFLREKKCEITIDGNKINIDGIEAIVGEIESLIIDLGGINVIKSIFLGLSSLDRYSTSFERYFLNRNLAPLPEYQRPQIPYGYLINLALKCPIEKEKTSNYEKKLSQLFTLAVAVTNIYGVQKYHIYEDISQNGSTIIDHCKDLALWDSIFRFQQLKPSNAFYITKKLFEYIPDKDFETSLGFSINELFSVIVLINNLQKKDHQILFVYTSFIQNKLKKINQNKIELILNFLSHTKPVNKEYLLPDDYVKIDFFLKPLIKISKSKFVLLNKSLCAPNYFEALATHFRKIRPNFDSELGYQLEKLLQEKLSEKGITFHSGEYNKDKIDAGECDLLIESDDAIVLIEFKKKPLTRKAKAGIDNNILIDLGDSLFSAQIQAGKVEIILRENGSIKLTDRQNKIHEIILNGREIERVALSQLEFGGFQDKEFTRQFLLSFLTHTFHTNSQESQIIKGFKKIDEKREVINKQHSRLCDLNESYKTHPFFCCWFLGLPQLFEIIELATDNNSFYKSLTSAKHIIAVGADWYYEFDYANKLKNNR